MISAPVRVRQYTRRNPREPRPPLNPDYGTFGTNNIYDNPEKWRLTILGSLDAGGGDDFDTFVSWIDDFGNIYYAADSGCSCPTPFENIKSMADLTRVENAEGLRQAARAWALEPDWEGQIDSSSRMTENPGLLDQIETMVRKADRLQKSRKERNA